MKARSYVQVLDPGGNGFEANAFTCGHCNAVVIVRKETQFGSCRMCWKNICTGCEASGRCDPFEKKLERLERSARFAEAMEQ